MDCGYLTNDQHNNSRPAAEERTVPPVCPCKPGRAGFLSGPALSARCGIVTVQMTPECTLERDDREREEPMHRAAAAAAGKTLILC